MNIELRLLATMLYRGDFSPLIRGDITADHFVTEEGKILHGFITTYRSKTEGIAKFPSLSVVQHRFAKTSNIELPEPDPGDSVETLAYETSLQLLRARLKEAAVELENAANAVEPLDEAMAITARLRSSTEVVRRGQHTSLASGILDITQNYCEGTILPYGIAWPWPSMTRATKGLQRKEFVVIAGRPKSRKTFTALSILMHALQNQGARTLVFTPEMPVRQMLLRCVAMLAKLRYTEFKDGTLDQAEEMRLFEAARDFGIVDGEDEEYYQLRLSAVLGFNAGVVPALDVVQSTGRDLSWMESQISLYRPDVVLFDSFYRQHTDGTRKDAAEWRTVTALSRGIKDLCMSSNICGIGTHQLNRGAQKELGDISNLSLADAVGQDADMILRVITGKVDGVDRSALVVLGGREVPFDGILFNNIPCCDYEEVGPITSLKVVERLMKAEDKEEEETPSDSSTGSSNGNGASTGIMKKQLARKELMRRAKQNATASAFLDGAGSEEPEDVA